MYSLFLVFKSNKQHLLQYKKEKGLNK